jgi:hypothetical protein
MSKRVRKALGGLGILAFLTVYAVAAVTLAGHLPDNKAIQMIYFVAAGVVWGLPLVPVIKWMEGGR